MNPRSSGLDPLDVLFEVDDLPAVDLPAELERLYGGKLGFRSPALFANFVSTIDGVVAIPAIPNSNRVISADSDADRFVMGLLRAFADAIVIGSGTLHGSVSGRWQPEGPYPPTRAALAELRRDLGLSPVPELAILTASGAIDVGHPAFERGALVLTTDHGRAALSNRLPPASAVESLGDSVDPHAVVSFLRERGHSLVLSEGGPTVFGSLLAAGLVDELFLTVSPLLAGRNGPHDTLQLVEGAALLPGAGISGRLLSARRHGSHLFLRYALS